MESKTVITRARLAGRLQAAGYEVRKIPNLYDATRPAWEVELDSVSADIIAAYYAKAGKVPPAAVRRYLEGGRQHGQV